MSKTSNCRFCYKPLTSKDTVYVVNNNSYWCYCSKDCLNRDIKNKKDKVIKEMTVKSSFDDNLFINMGDVILVNRTYFSVAEHANGFYLVNLSKGKLVTHELLKLKGNYNDVMELQTDLDKVYGNDNYQIIKKDHLIKLLRQA